MLENASQILSSKRPLGAVSVRFPNQVDHACSLFDRYSCRSRNGPGADVRGLSWGPRPPDELYEACLDAFSDGRGLTRIEHGSGLVL